jgi:hypothetical protein
MSGKTDEQYGRKEAQARFEAALKGAMNTPHKPLKEKPKKREASKPASRPRSRKKSGDNRKPK